MVRFKKIIGFIHLWLGLISGLVVFVVALTGALYVFQEEIDSVVYSKHHYVPKEDKPFAPMSVWLDSSNKAFHNYPVFSQRSVYWNNTPGSVVTVDAYYTKEGKEHYLNAYLNPYTGEVVDFRERAEGDLKFWDVVIDLHMRLMLGDFGSYLVRYGTLVFLILLISGIILWWPKNKSAFKQRYKFSWKESTKWKRKNYDLHNVLGFYACWIVVFMAITGLVWSFEWFSNGLYFTLTGGKQPTEQVEKDGPKNKAARSLSDIEKSYNALAQKYPFEYRNAKGFYIYAPTDTTGENISTYISFDPKGIVADDYKAYHYNRATASLTAEPDIVNAGEWLIHFNGGIHYGSIFGLPSKILVFFACLIATSLPVTGFLVWMGRKKKSKTEKKPKVAAAS